MGRGAADRAPVADLEVSDVRQGASEERGGGRDVVVALGRRLANHRSHPEVVVRALDGAELGDPVEVDQALEAREAQREHRHEALPAGEHLGVVAMAGEQLDGLGERVRRLVGERRRLHRRVTGA